MRDVLTTVRTRNLGERHAWFRLAAVVVALGVVALTVLMVAPHPAGPMHASAQFSDAGGAVAGGGPSNIGRHPVAPTTLPPPTTVPPAPTTTATPPPPPKPVTTVPAPRVVAPPPAPRPAPPAVAAGLLPPRNPPANIAPQPNFLAACSASADDNSSGCINASVGAIDNARRSEGLPGLTLPSNWVGLSPQEQLFVGTNLERTVRGLPALSAMATLLDQSAGTGAATGNDPSPPGGFPFEQWGANWAGGMGNPLEAIYYWMYDDGPGSSNADCNASHPSGCWGHRDEILLSLTCTPCVMGTGFAGHGWNGQPSWAELLVGSRGSPQLDFTWQQEAPYLH